MRRIIKIPARVVLVVLFVFFSMGAQSFAAKPLPIKTFKVGVAVTPVFKKIPNWKGQFERRLAYASKIFKTQFKIEFEVAAYWDWTPPDEKYGTMAALDHLRQKYPLRGVDIVIGLSKLSKMPDFNKIKDPHVIGRARPLQGYVMLRYPNNPLFKIQEETVLVHELGHLFGAIHTEQGNTIMSPIVDKQIPTRFDLGNQEIIKLTREVDFSKDESQLDARVSQQLVGSYLKMIIHEQSFDFYYALGLFYINLGQLKDAAKTWEKAKKIEPDNPQIHYDLGFLYSKLKETSKSIKELNRALAGLKHPSQKYKRARALDVLAAGYFNSGNHERAYQLWNQLLAIEPNNKGAKINLAIVQLKKGQYDKSIRALKKFLREDPNNVRLLSYIGAAYFHKGDSNMAIRYLTDTVDVIKKNSKKNKKSGLEKRQLYETYHNLGSTYQRMNNHSKAASYIKAACRVYGSVECHKRLGEIYFQMGSWNNAINQLAGVVQRDKKDVSVYGMLGSALSKKGGYKQALGVFNKGLEHAKERNVKAHMRKSMGYLYIQLEQMDFAVKEFRISIQNRFDDPEAHFGLGIAEMGKGNLFGSQRALEQAIHLNPKHQKARDLLATVKKNMAESRQNISVSISGTGTLRSGQNNN